MRKYIVYVLDRLEKGRLVEVKYKREETNASKDTYCQREGIPSGFWISYLPVAMRLS